MKKCKGTGKAKGHGCNNPLAYSERNGLKNYSSTYGLCIKCVRVWAVTENDGKNWLKKQTSYKMKANEKEKKKITAEKRKTDIEKNRPRSWHEKELQRVVNRIVRELDKGHNCISSNKQLNSKYDAGHYYSVGSNPTLRYNLHNIFAQSVSDNQYKGGNPIEYISNVAVLFGEDYANEMLLMRQKHKVIKLSIPELKTAKNRAKKFLNIILGYKSGNKYYKFTTEQRISLRRDGNFHIGIYKEN